MKDSRAVTAPAFKDKCLAVLDDVATAGREVFVTRRRGPDSQGVPIDGHEAPTTTTLSASAALVGPSQVALPSVVVSPGLLSE